MFSTQTYQFECCLFFAIFTLVFIWYTTIMFSAEHFDMSWLQKGIRGQQFSTKQNDWSKSCTVNITTDEYERLFPKNVDKYLFATWGGLCGGLGNQMWRFASLYGIGKPYGRKPIFKEDQKCEASHGSHETAGVHEIEKLFPIYFSQIKYIKPEEKENDTFYMKGFAPGCCAYEDPQKLINLVATFAGYYFQSYKFFETRRTEIRQIFQFGHDVCNTVETYKNELFRSDQAHKFCVHIRIEDFKNFGIETKKDFTEQGIEFVFNYLKGQFDEISIVLLGVEKQFLMDLKFNEQLFSKVYLPKAMPRGEDMAFATTSCDSLLITASSSTFSWWIAYLMPDKANIFYNSKFEGTPYERENFLSDWIPIRLINGTMTLD